METVIFEKFVIFYFFIVTLSAAIKFNEAAEFNIKSNKLLNVSSITATEANDMWQPIIQQPYWLPTPTVIVPALSAATKSLRRSLYSKNARSRKVKEKHNFTLNTTQNYGKQFAKPLMSTAKLTTQPLQQTPVTPYMKLEPHQLGKQNDTNEQQQFNPYHQPILSSIYNTPENQYPQIQMSKNIMHREQMYPRHPPLPHQVANASSYGLTRFNNFNYLMDMAKHKELLTNPALSSLSVGQNMAEAKHSVTLPSAIKNLSLPKAVSFPIQIISNAYKDSSESIVPTTLNSLVDNETPIDTIRKPQYQKHRLNPKSNIDVKYIKVDDKEAVKAAEIATAAKSNDSVENFLEKSKGFDNHFKHETGSNNDKGKHNDSDASSNEVFSSSADASNNDTAIEVLTAMAQQLIEATSTTLSAAIAASLEKLESFDIQSIFFSAPTATSFLPAAYDSAEVIPQIPDSSTKSEIASPVAALTTIPTIPQSAALTLNSSTAAFVSSGRKLKKDKKVKKKFQQILLPLLLAYKLKFVALMPLLAGGLILLVGSTGLAGFFFALFAAVMSLQSGHGNAIVIKKD